MSVAFVQTNFLDANASPGPYSIPFLSNNTAGNLLVYVQRNNSDTPSTFTDSQNNSWVSAPGSGGALWYAKNCKGGANTLAIGNGAAGHLQATIAEYSGLDVTNPFDQITAGAGTGTTATSPAITPSKNGCLIISFGENGTTNSPVITAGAGYTMRGSGTHNSFLEDLVQTTAAPITGTATYNASVSWTQKIASFLPTSAYSVQDSRNFGNFPNLSRNVQGTLHYDVPSVFSLRWWFDTLFNRTQPQPVDSRTQGAPVDSRNGTAPQNSRTFPPF
jgi:hypothetical protein